MGERDFGSRERVLVSLFHIELGRLIGRSLASAVLGPTSDLSPRLHETLRCLLEGDSEKQVAMRMGLSHATVHQSVTMLYRRFDVHSRAELLARVLRRRVIPRGDSPRSEVGRAESSGSSGRSRAGSLQASGFLWETRRLNTYAINSARLRTPKRRYSVVTY